MILKKAAAENDEVFGSVIAGRLNGSHIPINQFVRVRGVSI